MSLSNKQLFRKHFDDIEKLYELFDDMNYSIAESGLVSDIDDRIQALALDRVMYQIKMQKKKNTDKKET
tara:strand:- start:483 stop:689 length:207 start_codon:yes stop_codon:yes gene_type:complete